VLASAGLASGESKSYDCEESVSGLGFDGEWFLGLGKTAGGCFLGGPDAVCFTTFNLTSVVFIALRNIC